MHLLQEIRSHNIDDYLISIWKCSILNAPVVGAKHYITKFQISLDDSFGTNDDEKLHELAMRSQDMIDKGHFSRINDPSNPRWGPFTTEEREFIDSVIASSGN